MTQMLHIKEVNDPCPEDTKVFSLRLTGSGESERAARRLPLLKGRDLDAPLVPLTESEERFLTILEQTEGVEGVDIDEENALVVIAKSPDDWGRILVAIERGVEDILPARDEARLSA